jgi:hypothetical protein
MMYCEIWSRHDACAILLRSVMATRNWPESWPTPGNEHFQMVFMNVIPLHSSIRRNTPECDSQTKPRVFSWKPEARSREVLTFRVPPRSGHDHFILEPFYQSELEFFLLPTDSRPVRLGIGPPFGTLDQIYLALLSLSDNYFILLSKVSSLTRKRVCSLQWNHSLRTNNHTLPSHLRLCSLFVASYDVQGLRWRYSNPPPHGALSIHYATWRYTISIWKALLSNTKDILIK